MKKAIFEGLVFDEFDQLVKVTYVGSEPCYVVDDQGFHRHIPSKDVDYHVFKEMHQLISGNEELLSKQAADMLGIDDIFSEALIAERIKNPELQLEDLSKTGLPEEVRSYLGMMGLKIRINIHGEVISVEQPGIDESDDY